MIYNSKSTQHNLYSCPDPKAREVKDRVKEYRSRLRVRGVFSNLSTCYWCFQPPNLCDKWVPKDNQPGWTKTDQKCSYPDIALDIFAVGLSLSTFQELYSEQLRENEVDLSSKEEETRFLGETVNWAGLEISTFYIFFQLAISSILEHINSSIR